jgi:hypothetical protein
MIYGRSGEIGSLMTGIGYRFAATAQEETRGPGDSLPGQVELTITENLDQMRKNAKTNWKQTQSKHKLNTRF